MRALAALTALTLLAQAVSAPVCAQDLRQAPLSLPQTLRATLRVPLAQPVADDTGSAPIDTLRALYPALGACWREPEGLKGFERTEITARFSLRRDGSLIGPPRITFSLVPGDSRTRELLIAAALDAIARCTPVNVTPGLGGAIAGRPIALRFIYNGPKGRGV